MGTYLLPHLFLQVIWRRQSGCGGYLFLAVCYILAIQSEAVAINQQEWYNMNT